MATTTKKTTRRARGTGSIFKRGNRWVGRKPVGRTATGKTVYREVWGKTQAEVVKRLGEVGPPRADCTVNDWAVRWRKTLTIRPASMNNVNVALDQHILPVIGHLRLAEVTSAHIESLIADLRKTHAVGTVCHIISKARAMFGAAERAGHIRTNPARLAKKPRIDVDHPETFTPAELARIIEVAADCTPGGIVAVLAATGARVGEILALDVPDWNPDAGTIAITKTFSARFGMGPPKSRHSRRTIAVPAVAIPFIEAAIRGRTRGPLFPSRTGKRRSNQGVDNCWRVILRAAELPYRKLHSMRHSVATMLIGAGMPLPDAGRFLGDTTATLAKYYLHPTGRNPAELVNSLLGGRKVAAGKQKSKKAREMQAKAG